MNRINSDISYTLSRVFHGMYGLLWLLLLPGILFQCLKRDYMMFLPFLACLFLLYLTRNQEWNGALRKHIRHLGQSLCKFIDSHSLLGMVVALLAIQILLQMICGHELAVVPSSDRSVIFQQSVEIATTGRWHTSETYNYYFLRYPNNMLLLILEASYFMLLKGMGIGNFLYGNMALNLFAIDLSILLGVVLVYRKYGRHYAVLCQLMAVLFIPYYTYIPFVYTDTLVLPIIAGILLSYDILEKNWNCSNTAHYITPFVIGLLTWTGYELKPTTAIVSFACILHMIIAKHWKKGLLCSFFLLLTFTVCSVGFDAVIGKLDMVDQTDYDTENFPYTHWIMMGLKGNGNYNLADREYTSSFYSREDKKEGNIGMIQTRLDNYGVTGLLVHQYKKGVSTWSNGKYDMEYHLGKDYLKKSPLHSIFLKKGMFYHLYSGYCSIFHLFLLLLLAVSIVQGFREETLDSAVVWKLALFGLLLFLSIWESKSRYLMHFTPLLFLIAIDTIRSIRQLQSDAS